MCGKKTTILVVDGDVQIQKLLTLLLEDRGFKVITGGTGKQAIRLSDSVNPDLMLLELELPDISGNAVVAALRRQSQLPIIMLSTHSADHEVTAALNIGANDYVTKPFNMDVLLARINAALRSVAVHEAGEPELRNGTLHMDLVRHEVFVEKMRVALTPKEYDLLRYFMIHRGKMLTHKDILRAVWGAAHSDDTAYLRVYIGQIRDKIEANPTQPTVIITKPGIGYRMEITHENIPHAPPVKLVAGKQAQL